jgi:hypothetical protein
VQARIWQDVCEEILVPSNSLNWLIKWCLVQECLSDMRWLAAGIGVWVRSNVVPGIDWTSMERSHILEFNKFTPENTCTRAVRGGKLNI